VNASPQRRCRATRLHGRGFTLLELLLVLVLVALAAGLVAPAGVRAIEAARERGWRADLLAAVQALPARAFFRGQSIELDADGLRRLVPDAPAGLVLTLDQPLQYAPNGAASGARLELAFAGRPVERWRVQALTGQLLPDAD
jgi:prepilin-type N-terminal cleavage/methylation domain-containing protein